MDFAKASSLKLVNEYQETRSGMRKGNPMLTAAIAECYNCNAILLIAKLDRLKRNVAFIATLMESCIRFRIVEHPHAEEFELHILAAVAQKEGRDISKRTKDALAAAKRRGTLLGKYGRDVLSKRNRIRADKFALKMCPIINAIRKQGKCSLRSIVDELNRINVPAYRQGKWHLNTVYNLIKRQKQITSIT